MADIFGGPGDDVLPGTPDDDQILGGGGNDIITGLGGDDIILGEDGDDELDGGDGDDSVLGGNGADTILLGAGHDNGNGGEGDDILHGGAGNDNLFGENSSETEAGITGDDQLYGGDGDDFLRGGLGNDYLDGGTGSDRASYYSLASGVHVDLRIQGSTQDTLAGGFDTLVNVENVAGTVHADVLIGNHEDNWFWSHGGADDITGNAGNDTFWIPDGDANVRGGQGFDIISFRGRIDNTGTDTGGVSYAIGNGAFDTGRGVVTSHSIEGAEGSEFNDTLTGNNRDNQLSGWTGDDVIDGRGGDDLIYGDHSISEVGENPLSYNYDDPALAFAAGDDVLSGGGGDDLIYGNGGDDIIDGGNGRDTLVGGMGADRIDGGNGRDQFVYTSAAESTGESFDTIVGFKFKNGDVFDLPVAVTSVATLTGGALDAASFDADLALAMSTVLSANTAVVYTATSGSYAGETFLVVDGDGVFGYTAGADFVFLLEDPKQLNHISVDGFI